MNGAWKQRLDSALRECDTHLLRIARSRRLLMSIFPLDPAKLAGLDDEQVEHIDQLIFRFSKLQDAMGTRLYPSIYVLIESDDSPRPFLDILSRLEKYGIVRDAAVWQFFRNLRNNFAHDYPENPEQSAASLNTLFARWEDFEALYTRARAYVDANRHKLGLG
jgi:hypothetical protein